MAAAGGVKRLRTTVLIACHPDDSVEVPGGDGAHDGAHAAHLGRERLRGEDRGKLSRDTVETPRAARVRIERRLLLLPALDVARRVETHPLHPRRRVQ